MASDIPGTVSPMVHAAGTFGRQVLKERTPKPDIYELNPPADSKDGQPALPGHGKQSQLEDIPLAAGRAQQG
jgi:hypothetical protein